MILLKDIVKKYRTDTVLNHIDLSLKLGTMTSLVGVSGCGKTSLIKIIAGMDRCYNGNYFLCDSRVSGMSDQELSVIRAEVIGYVPQEIYLIEEETVMENILLSFKYGKNKELVENFNIDTADYLEKLGIAGFMDKKVNQLSGGERKRVMIARAMAKNPAVIIADEPTSGLDSKNCKMVIELLREYQKRNATILVATHDSLVSAACDHIINMEYGALKYQNSSVVTG